MTRRRWLSALARILTAWALLTVQGVCDTAHLATLTCLPAHASLASARPNAGKPLHAVLCHCKMCRGGKKCCCLVAGSDRDAAAFRSVCDTPDDSRAAGLPGPLRALPPVAVAIAAPRLRPLLPIVVSVPPIWDSQTFQPATPPPAV